MIQERKKPAQETVLIVVEVMVASLKTEKTALVAHLIVDAAQLDMTVVLMVTAVP